MAILINKFSPIPLYLQLKNSIKENIANGTFKPGDKIPTEEEICNTYRISRTVTKQALSELVSEGYLVRYKSKGTFVNSNKNTGFFHEIIKSVHDVSSLFVFARMQPVMKLEADEIATFTEYFQFIKQKISDNHNHFRKDLIRTLMLAMFYDVGNVIYRVKNFDESLLRSEKVFTRFLKMVEENCKRERRVSWYAQQLNITPKYLSTAVKRISGRTAVEWIESYVTMELRVLLKNSTKSIKEITEELNFPNQSFLGKYFKEHVGMTPSAYRKS